MIFSVLFLLGPLAAAALGLPALCTEPPIEFLPDDAQVSCRAILPQCFTRKAWAQLCESEPGIRKSFNQACDLAFD